METQRIEPNVSEVPPDKYMKAAQKCCKADGFVHIYFSARDFSGPIFLMWGERVPHPSSCVG